MTQGSIPPGWYDDGQGTQRWWDGSGWTEHTQPGGSAAPATPAEPTPAAEPAADNPFSEPTRIARPDATPAEGVALEKPTGGAPQAPEAAATPTPDVTMMAPSSGSDYPQPGQPAYGQQPGYPVQGGYAQPGQPGQPGQPAYGQQPGYPQQGQPAWQTPYPPAGSGSSGGGKGKLFAIIGGAAAVLLVGVVLLVVLLGGGGGAEGAAKDYLEAQADLDFERACELTAEDSQKEQLDNASAKDCEEFGKQSDEFVDGQFGDYIDDVDIDVEIDKVSEDGDEADVDYTVKSKYTGDDPDGFKEAFDSEDLEETNTGSLKMVKEDGDWKVAEDN